jgi:hypothetical protein
MAAPYKHAPSREAFRPAERALIDRLSSPRRVQNYLNRLPYNQEKPPQGESLRSFRSVVETGTAHCLEAALTAAVVLEQHGLPPLVLSFESIDKLEHVIYVFRMGGRWGSIARSRDPGLHGRKPVFRTARALAMSYFDPYIDLTGCITAFAVIDMHELMGKYDWRFSSRNMWKVERALIDYPHAPLPVDKRRVRRLRQRYKAFLNAYPDRKPVRYRGREHWTALPAEFTRTGYDMDWVIP